MLVLGTEIEWTHPLNHSTNILLSVYQVPETVIGVRDTAVYRLHWITYAGETLKKKNINVETASENCVIAISWNNK